MSVVPNGILGGSGVLVPALNLPEIPLYSTSASNTAVIQANSVDHELYAATNGSSSYRKMRRTLAHVNTGTNTAPIGTATLCASTAGLCANAAAYTVHAAFTEIAGATVCTTGGVTLTLAWTDANGSAHSHQMPVISTPLGSTGALVSGSQFNFEASPPNAVGIGTYEVTTNGSVIQYSTGYANCTGGSGTASYQLTLAVEGQ